MRIIKEIEIIIPNDAIILNVLILRKRIQRVIWSINPNLSQVKGIKKEGNIYHIYVPTNIETGIKLIITE